MRTSVFRLLGIVLVGCVLTQFVVATSGQWRNYTAKNQLRAAVQHGETGYVVTSGGMFSYINNGEIIETFTTSEGLSAIDLTAIARDENGILWIGASGGYLDGFDPEDHSWRRVRDITRTDFSQRDILTMSTRGDSLYVGTSFGISVYSVSRNEFNDSYIKFGVFPTQTPVTSITFDDSYIWVGTTRGVARGKIDDPLLAAPDRWDTFRTGLPSESIQDIVFFDSHVYVATAAGLAYYDGQRWNSVPGLQGNIVALAAHEHLYVATERDIYRIDQNRTVTRYGEQLAGPVTGLFIAGGELRVLVNNYGVAYHRDGWQYITLDGPSTNFFVSVDVDQFGTVWSGTGSTVVANGFIRFNPGDMPNEQWWNVPRLTYLHQNPQTSESSSVPLYKYHRARAMADGTVWLSLWGEGVSRIILDKHNTQPTSGDVVYEDDDIIIEHYYLKHGLAAISGSAGFVVIGNTAMDSRRNVWITNYDANNGMPLVQWSPDGTLSFHRNLRNSFVTIFTDLIIDRYDTKWIISRDPAQRGIFYFNENESIGTQIDGWGVITTQNGLPSQFVNALVEDNRGEIWIGTEAGLSVITNPREPQNSVRDIFVLQDQYINSIAVDPLNRKWVGTHEGVFLISPDGTSLIQHYNVQNTDNQLLSNDVRSVTFDDNRGIVYFGTERGLSSMQTVAVAPRPQFEELFVSPNPYRIPAEYELKIDGLMRNSSVKILSVDGRLVRSFTSPGGRVAFWDGRDDTGKQVASGVYIVVGLSEDGTEVGKSKVTIIRK
jgi:ligand-binding sensor domain-containing protein